MTKILMGETTIGEVSYKSSPEDRQEYAGQILKGLRDSLDAHGGMWESEFFTNLGAKLTYCHCCNQQAWKWSLRIIHSESMASATVVAKWHGTTEPIVRIVDPSPSAHWANESLMTQIIEEINESIRLKALVAKGK